jgi:acyl-coenzyme A thioesterase PaaI-like protein
VSLQESQPQELVLGGNTCFGCGEANDHGLHVSVYLEPNARRLRGEFRPRPEVAGIPGITHGGALYTTMDCMATWTGMALKQTKALWVLRSATMTYHRPARAGSPISLTALIEEEGEDWDAMQVRVDARDSDGELLVEGQFKVIPLAPDRFKALLGLQELPAGWTDWLEGRVELTARKPA